MILRAKADPCIYFKHVVKGQKDFIIIIALYVDDLIITSPFWRVREKSATNLNIYSWMFCNHHLSVQ